MWLPQQYERFKSERRQPFVDLLALIDRRPAMRLLDLGCGTGELTRELHDHLGAAETVGIDQSETMLGRSANFASERLRFERQDIAEFVPARPFNLVFSNAALHWLPDHELLFRRLVTWLAPSGQLAVQMPANDRHASHRLAADLAREFGIDPKPTHTLPAERYAVILHELGFQRQNVRVQIYGHLLSSSADVVEWVKGTLLTDYEERLGSERFATFLDEYRKRVIAAFPATRPYFYTYNRILLWGAL